MRQTIDLNFNWLFKNEFYDDYTKNYANVAGFELVDIPHNAVDIQYNYFKFSSTQLDCTYKKEIFVEETWKDKVLLLEFDGVSNISNIFINDEFVATHRGAYTSFTCDISEYVQYGNNNMITIYVNSNEHSSVPPHGGQVNFLGYCGIYREVRLHVLEPAYIKNLFIKTPDAVSASNVNLSLELSQSNGMLEIVVLDQDIEMVNTRVQVSGIQMNLNVDVHSKRLWTLDDPQLYYVRIRLIQDDVIVDEIVERFGFREVRHTHEGFFLNNEKIKLIGLNRHQSYPYVGNAMPKGIQEEDADILKYQLGCNIVRCSNYPQSKHFLNRCDEIGLLVIEEIPGSSFIGGDEWKEASLRFLQAMMKRDRNHPSICMWSIRIPNSDDNTNFYSSMNQQARALDDTRPMLGVRNFVGSELLEDVYGFSDYSYNGKNDALLSKAKVTKKKHPYLVTEHTGYRYPTKAYDHETHLLNQALRHLAVLDCVYGRENIAGAIGSTMCDFNNVQDFASRDGVSYHGVLDMFRNPKLASFVYSAEHTSNVIMELAANMDDTVSNMEGFKMYAFTNCDYIKLYRNDDFIATFYPDKKAYPNLKHPPVIIDDFIGEFIEKREGISKKDSTLIKNYIRAMQQYGYNLPLYHQIKMKMLRKRYNMTKEEGLALIEKYTKNYMNTSFRFDGYQEDKVVISKTKDYSKKFKYVIETNRKTLEIGKTYDAVRVVVKKLNQNKEVLTYAQDAIRIETSGSIQLIGPQIVNLLGGQISFWVRTHKETGVGTIKIITQDQEMIETFMVKKK